MMTMLLRSALAFHLEVKLQLPINQKKQLACIDLNLKLKKQKQGKKVEAVA